MQLAYLTGYLRGVRRGRQAHHQAMVELIRELHLSLDRAMAMLEAVSEDRPRLH
jgi:hypothetical protein